MSKMGASWQAVVPTSLILSSRSKSSSKSERDLDRVVFSDQFESNPSRSSASRVEVALKMDIFLIYWARSGSNMSSRLSMKSSRSLLRWSGLRLLGVGQVAVEATQTVGDADPGAEDEGCALFEHSTGEVEGCHRILRWMLDEHPYLAR
jgi:hypothetical protein